MQDLGVFGGGADHCLVRGEAVALILPRRRLLTVPNKGGTHKRGKRQENFSRSDGILTNARSWGEVAEEVSRRLKKEGGLKGNIWKFPRCTSRHAGSHAGEGGRGGGKKARPSLGGGNIPNF